MLTGQGRSVRNKGSYLVQAMSEEQLKAVETEASAQLDDGVEEVSDDDLEGVAGGVQFPVVGTSIFTPPD